MNLPKTIKLLIVDDDEDDLYLIVDALQEVTSTRYDITTASSPLGAMNELSKRSFDVIFSDYRLGAVTGVDFIKSVRAARIDTPIILLTGISDQLIDNAALKAGSSDFIPKTAITADVLDRSVRYALAHSERQSLLQTVLKSTKSGIAVLDADGTISLTNAQFLDFAAMAFGDDADRKEKLIARTQCALEKDIVFDEHIFESHVTTLPDGTSIVALHDVTQRVNDLRDRERAEEKIRVVAMQDALTGLPNRMDFNAHLDDCLAKARLESASVAVLLFDFNRFKEVNDLFGHAAGDQILRTAAARLREVLTEGEYCARLGGDEFVLIQYGCTSDSAIELARRVVDCLQLRIEWEDKIIEASVTLGVATFPSQGESRQELLANADLAMYRGKSAVDRSVCVFDASMDQFIRNRRALAHDLRRAIVDDELTLDLQPQVGSSAGEVVGFESLLRWHSPSRGMVSPAEFIPIAEENGLIIEIDKWVLQRSCRLLAQHAWLPRLAVNISARAICQSNLVNEIRATLLESGISPARLELEVTETALVHDLTRALHNLRQIKALGISIAMDDFGTGYSSLSLLNSFPFDRIKIDGSFIQLTGNNERADAIFKAVIGLGAALRVPVLAEGIETEQQLLFAIESGCEELQGFHFGRPISERLMVELWTALNGRMTLANLKEWQDLHNRKAPDQTAYQMATG